MSRSNTPLVSQQSSLLFTPKTDAKHRIIGNDEYFDVPSRSEETSNDITSSPPHKQSTLSDNVIESVIDNPFINTDTDIHSHESIDYIQIPMAPMSPIEHYMLYIPQTLYDYTAEIIATFKFTWKYVISQIKRTPRSFIIGCSTILIVVAFISLLYDTIDKAGLVFLKLAEVKVGENDLLIHNSMNIQLRNDHNTTNTATNITLPMMMNYTAMYDNIYANNESDFKYDIKGLAPRWVIPSVIKLKHDSTRNASILAQIINSTQEKLMQLSRSWKYDKLLYNECYLTRSVMRHLGFDHNEQIIGQVLQLNIGDVLSMIATTMNPATVRTQQTDEDNSDNNTRSDQDDAALHQQENAVNMAKIIYFIAYVSGVDLYPPFGNKPEILSNDNNSSNDANCYANIGMEYRGTQSFTKSGLQCQSWFVDTPHNISYHTTKYSTNLFHNNFCRNPNNGSYFSTKPWCFTVSSQANEEKETCNIPNCLQDYTQCKFLSYNASNYNVSNFAYTQTCDSGIILSVQYAFFGLFNGTQCNDNFNGEDIFVLNDRYCYQNMTQYVYDECIGKYECVIDDLLKYVNYTQFEQCPLYDDNKEVQFKFIVELECNFPYEWDQKVYVNDTITNITMATLEQIPWFLLPIDENDEKENMLNALEIIRGKTLSIDEIRWILLIATLSNFNFNLDFVVKDIINEPDGKWSQELGGVMLIESKFVENYIQNSLGGNLDKISMYLEIINYIIQNYTAFDSNDEEYDIANIVSLFIEASIAVDSEHEANPDQHNKISGLLSKFKINNFAQITIVNAKNRLNIYQKSYNQIRTEISNFGSKLILTTNDLSSTVNAPLLKVMQALSFLKILLNSITTSMTVIIGILSCIIIYCLMIIDVENKTFECGVLRSIGMMKKSLIYILNMKSLLFCIPGIIIGLFVSTLISIPLSNIIADYVTVEAEYMLSLRSILYASLVFGLLIPIISGIVPLRKALATTLSNSLNLYFNSVDAVFVEIINHNEYGINFTTLVISLLLVLVSFVCLYVIPYCVVTENFPLFFTIFDLIFLGLLCGLCIIALTIQNKLDLFICKLLMSWGPQKKIKYLVYKNIHSHKSRNNKTGIMLILSCAFIVFSGCMVALQSDNFNSLFTVLSGADIVFQSVHIQYSLPEYTMRETFASSEYFSKLVEGYTFVTWSIDKLHYVEKFSFGPLGRDHSAAMHNSFIGVEENYCNVAYCAKYLVISGISQKIKKDPNFPRLLYNKHAYDPIAGLYYNYNKSFDVIFPPKDIISGHVSSGAAELSIKRNKERLNATYLRRINILTSTAMEDACGVSTDIHLKVNAVFKRDGRKYYYLRYASSPIIVSKVPGFWFSAHSQVANLMTTLTTMNEYNYLLSLLQKHFDITQPDRNNKTHGFPYNLGKQRLLIKMKNDTNQQDRTEIIDLVSSLLNNDYIIITDTKKTISGVEKTTDLLSIFFKLVAILTMSLCFFISFISFKQNVDDNIYQFGVLKSIGINNINIVLIFVFESIIITISSLFCGTIIGIGQSVAITLQSQILTENIFTFKFPTNLYLILIISSFIIAILSSVLPSIILIKTPPALILRM